MPAVALPPTSPTRSRVSPGPVCGIFSPGTDCLVALGVAVLFAAAVGDGVLVVVAVGVGVVGAGEMLGLPVTMIATGEPVPRHSAILSAIFLRKIKRTSARITMPIIVP